MNTQYKELLENLLHELASINSMIKTSAEILSKSAKGNFDREAISHHSTVILENSFLLSTQLDISNYHLNPEYVTEVEKFDKRNLYGKFHKAILSFKRIAKEKNINIIANGNIQTLIDSKPVIDTLPILLLDNAIKYSPKGCHIEIDFDEDDKSVEVTISNTGPHVTSSEIQSIFKRAYRGNEAIKTRLPGHGYGLDFVKFICDLHQATITVDSSNDITRIGDISYSLFTIKILFPKRIELQ